MVFDHMSFVDSVVDVIMRFPPPARRESMF
jgi:hypothetical protein